MSGVSTVQSGGLLTGIMLATITGNLEVHLGMLALGIGVLSPVFRSERAGFGGSHAGQGAEENGGELHFR